jgi:hypothetical protein
MLIFSFSDGQRKYDGFHSKFREAFPFTTKSCRNVLDNFVCLSAWKTRGWLNGFLLNFTHNTFTGIYTHFTSLVKIGQQCALCMKPFMHFCIEVTGWGVPNLPWLSWFSSLPYCYWYGVGGSRQPLHCDHFWSIVHPHLSSHNSSFIHQSFLEIASRDI